VNYCRWNRVCKTRRWGPRPRWDRDWDLTRVSRDRARPRLHAWWFNKKYLCLAQRWFSVS